MKTQFAIAIDGKILPSRYDTIEDAKTFFKRNRITDEGFKIFEIIRDVTPKPKFPQTYDDAIDYLVNNDKCNITRRNYTEREIAFSRLILIADVWNEIDGFVPDFTDGNSYKYSPTIYFPTNKVDVISSFQNKKSPFYFRTYEIAKQFGETFKNLLKTI